METLRRFVLVALVGSLLFAVSCTGRKGTKVRTYDHSTYPHHYHDKNSMPHPKFGGPLPPPHNHHHGPTWK